MKICLISLSTPTFNNVRAASALPYHLIRGAKENDPNCEFDVFTFNINEMNAEEVKESEEALDVKISMLEKPRVLRWMFRFHLLFLRVLMRYPLYSLLKISPTLADKIKAANYDIVWIYGEELAALAKLFPDKKCIVTMPDCESMFYHRLLQKQFAVGGSLLRVLRYAFAYWQYRSMEHDFWCAHAAYHFVGAADAAFYEWINKGAKAVFLRHPLYFVKPHDVKFHKPKIKLLFAGRYDFYCAHGSDDLLGALLDEASLKDNFELTFLGKGWDEWCRKLCEAGWTASHITFAPNYVEELQRHDIQVNAIDVGTGTKGKVLDAVSNGLLAVGTPFALENIDVPSGEGCFVYNWPAEAVAFLKGMPGNVSRYEEMARRGRERIIASHNAARIAKELFEQEETGLSPS